MLPDETQPRRRFIGSMVSYFAWVGALLLLAAAAWFGLRAVLPTPWDTPSPTHPAPSLLDRSNAIGVDTSGYSEQDQDYLARISVNGFHASAQPDVQAYINLAHMICTDLGDGKTVASVDAKVSPFFTASGSTVTDLSQETDNLVTNAALVYCAKFITK